MLKTTYKFFLWFTIIILVVSLISAAASVALTVGLIALAVWGIYKGVIYYKNTKHKKEEVHTEQDPSTDN